VPDQFLQPPRPPAGAGSHPHSPRLPPAGLRSSPPSSLSRTRAGAPSRERAVACSPAAPASERLAPPAACPPARSATLGPARDQSRTAVKIRSERAWRVCACLHCNRILTPRVQIPHPCTINLFGSHTPDVSNLTHTSGTHPEARIQHLSTDWGKHCGRGHSFQYRKFSTFLPATSSIPPPKEARVELILIFSPRSRP